MLRRALAPLLVAITSLTTVSAQAADVCYQHPISPPKITSVFGDTEGRPNPHRGTDYGAGTGTPIGAVADGTVVEKTWSGCQGNVVVLAHADGMFSSYSHMNSGSPLQVGQSVSRGQTVGNVGATGTCQTGPHLHLTISDHQSGYYAGQNVDPYAYIEGHKVCSCDRSAGYFTFSCDGPQAGQTCTSLDEPGDPASSFNDNYLCSIYPIGVKWSTKGPIAGMECAAVSESVGPAPDAWKDNYLCLPSQAPYTDLEFSTAGPIAGKTCVQWNEPAAASWQDNYLCFRQRARYSSGIFTFSGAGPVDGMSCVNVNEPSDPDTWADNYFCSQSDIGMKWSYDGPIEGMKCANVKEGSEASPELWADNYLCLPNDSPYTFSWTSAGPLDQPATGKTCVRWLEHAEPLAHTWIDNWLCVDEEPPTTGGAGAGAEGGGAAGAPGLGGAAGSTSGASGAAAGAGASPNLGGGSGAAGHPGSTAAGGTAAAGAGAGAGAGDGAGHGTEEDGPPAGRSSGPRAVPGTEPVSEEGGCAIGQARTPAPSALLLALAVAARRLTRRKTSSRR